MHFTCFTRWGSIRSEHIIFMIKVPGVTLAGCYNKLPVTERVQVEAAFEEAIKYVRHPLP